MNLYNLRKFLIFCVIILSCSACSQITPPQTDTNEQNTTDDQSESTALVDLLTAQPLAVTDELIEKFYNYYASNERNFSLLPDFKAREPINWDELTLFIFTQYQSLFPVEDYRDSLTKEEFHDMVNTLLTDVEYTDQSSMYLNYDQGIYTCGNFDVGGYTYYRLIAINKNTEDLYTATFDRLYFYEMETGEPEQSKNTKVIYDSVGATELLQTRDFQPALLNIFLQDNYNEILDMTGTITVQFKLSNNALFPFIYQSCTRTTNGAYAALKP